MSKNDKEDKKSEETEKGKPQIPKEESVETTHTVIIDGKEISYTAKVGTVIIKAEEEEKEPKAKASIFHISYTLNDVSDMKTRPLTFSFNGGPGSSSVWLHLGVLGPKRVISATDDANAVPPPYELVDNEYSILDITDLVFIDPVSTGYSRAVPGEKDKQFHEYKKDIESVAEFIRLYTSRNSRWTSPKFLIGESYGTTRASGLGGYLQKELGYYLNGIMLVSSILNFQTARFDSGNDLPYLLFLPTYTSTAFYHKMLFLMIRRPPRSTLDEVRNFASNVYSFALLKGDSLIGDERQAIIDKLHRYTGLSKKYITGSNIRINIHKFVKELLRDSHRTVGRLDSRFTGIDRDDTAAEYEFDPSMVTILGPYASTFHDYVSKNLSFKSDLPYKTFARLYEKWKYEDFHNKYLDVGETLREAISINPYLQILVCNGYYDLATPFFATEYTFNHLGLDPSLRENISMTYYKAGHMMYIHGPSLAKMRNDLVAFIKSALK
jgi:carboxypeptidase C (cathepsin A)